MEVCIFFFVSKVSSMSVITILFFRSSLDINDFLHRELIDAVFHHTMEVEHLTTRLAEVVLLSVGERLCDQRVVAVRGRLEANDAAASGQLPCHHGVVTADENWDARAILGHVTRQNSRLSLHNNEVNA